jgi:hypothetical protein
VNIVPETLNQFAAAQLITQILIALVVMLAFGIVATIAAVKIIAPAMRNQAQLITGMTTSNNAVIAAMKGLEDLRDRTDAMEDTIEFSTNEQRDAARAHREAIDKLTAGIDTLNTTMTSTPQQLVEGFDQSLRLTAQAEGQKRNEVLTGIVNEGVKSMEQHVDKAVGEAEARLDQKINEITQAILDKIGELQKVVETKQADADVKRLIENLSSDVDRRLRNLEMQFMTMKGNSAPPILEAFDGALKDNARSTPPEGTKVPMFDPQPFDTTGELIDSVKAIKPGEDGNE